MSGKFIVFEGIDGSGKSTTISAVAGRLQAAGLKVLQLREPTEKTDASREIRRILRTAETIDTKISRDLLDLFLIDRLWDIKHQIAPALRSGSIVLLDRYYISTCAYQAADSEGTLKILRDYLDDSRVLKPDMVVFLNLPVQTAVNRLSGRGARDVFETETRLAAISARYATALAYLGNAEPSISIHELRHELVEKDFDKIANAVTGAAA